MQYNITYRKKDKGIQVIISYKDISGKWKQKSKQGFKKQSLAKTAADKMLDELKKNVKNQVTLNHDYDDITFEQFKDIFIEHIKLYNTYNTVATYERAFNKFSSLNYVKMADIQILDIQNIIDKLIKEGLKSSSIKLYLSKIKVFFNTAKDKYRIVLSSPVINIDIPKEEKEEKTALTKIQLEDLLSKIENKRYYIISLLAGKCGLRIGEIVGLTWDDISFKECTIKIEKQWKLIENKFYGFGSLKSKNSNRTVPMPETVEKEIKKYKDCYPINFDNRLFKIKNVDGIATRLSLTYKECGYNISVHELRHTYATMLISNGVDFKTVAQLLGHDVEQTIKTYSHVTNNMLDNASKIINQIL